VAPNGVTPIGAVVPIGGGCRTGASYLSNQAATDVLDTVKIDRST
jgi:hypothetical protein